MVKFRVLYLCNAIDEKTKISRHIQFNSQAATNKVFGLAKALQNQNIDIQVVSLGRGKQNGSKNQFPALHKIILGFPIHYAAFWHIPVVTHLVGAFSLLSLVRILSRGFQGKVIVIAYNRLWHYLPALVYSKFQRNLGFLDLEDGNIPSQHILGITIGFVRRSVFDFLCSNGAILAAKSLMNQVKTQHTFTCYGCTELQPVNKEKWLQKPINITFGGSLLYETGAQLLIDTVTWLESHQPDSKQKIQFTITGYGAMCEELRYFSESTGKGWINFLGDINHDSYASVLAKAQIGLCLKLSTSEMGKTTFPSKILEYASHGLAIISTRVSDVPDLLDDESAIFLEEETPQHLASIFQKIGNGFFDLQSIGEKGQERINSVCSLDAVGNNLKKFLMK
ncbi:MAG: glycosyltransferase family 4 protein, partial [Anaerolineae bacterium]|nr:glycosyltransferase family 4 protein [Anaerolineae bacterium]